ncbi:MAG: MerR family transcriptional regulator [Lachnospiraceae bacterium]|nr:MerR family transcriptional regulator [Lachnospiraceae bacterium]
METYMIKDAAKELNVEAHVLRYWEEELGLAIKRNSMGHRYYDEKDILIFKNVQELKKRGLSLKDIRDGIKKARSGQAGEVSIPKNEEITNEVQRNSVAKNEEITNEVLHNGVEKNDNLNYISEKVSDKSNEGKKEFVPLSKSLNQADNELQDRRVVDENDRKANEEKVLETIEGKKTEELKVVDFKMAQLQSVMNRVVANALRENKDIITLSIKEEITADVMKQFDTVMREKEEREEKRYKKLDEYLRELQRANAEAAATRDRGFFRRRRAKQGL